jgi:hypothetical protein
LYHDAIAISVAGELASAISRGYFRFLFPTISEIQLNALTIGQNSYQVENLLSESDKHERRSFLGKTAIGVQAFIFLGPVIGIGHTGFILATAPTHIAVKVVVCSLTAFFVVRTFALIGEGSSIASRVTTN